MHVVLTNQIAHILHFKVPNTGPCATLAFPIFQLEDWPFKTTLWHLLWRNDSIWSRISPFISLFFSLYRRPSCQTLSNVFDKSKKTPWTSNDGLASNALKVLWVIEISWLINTRIFWFKAWLRTTYEVFSIINSKIASKTSFSKTLEQIGTKDTRR